MTPFSKAKRRRIVKMWNPGFYWNPPLSDQDNGTLDGGGRIAAASWGDLITILQTYRALKGLMWRVSIDDLAISASDYSGIDVIVQRAVELKEIGKKLIILIPTRTFSSSNHAVPAWMRTGTYGGGEHAYGTAAPTIDGYNVQWGDTTLQAKVADIYSQMAIAIQAAAPDTLEMIGLSETATGTRITGGLDDPLSGAETTAYQEGMQDMLFTVQAANPLINYVHYVNSRTTADTLVPRMVALGVGMGCPDIWTHPEDNSPSWPENTAVWQTGAPQGTYRYYHDNDGVTPLLGHVQPTNYTNSNKKNIGTPAPTIQELLDAGKAASFGSVPHLNLTHMVWTADATYSSSVLAKLDESAQRDALAGGLNYAKPSTF